jgi:hypothetical protein
MFRAICRSHGLEEPKGAHPIVTLVEKQNRDHLQIHTLKNADFPSAIRPIPHSEGCLHQSLWIIF